tara:strand:+ start:90 stop:419 length:330 start_codon:yes stop_codon:yes gene_type:complete
MKKPSWLNWTTLLLMIILYGFLAGILFAFIYACYVAINDDDIVYNILGWVLITYAVGIGIYIPTLNFTEWLKKKNILNKNIAHYISIIPLLPLFIGSAIFTILLIFGLL